MHLVGVAAQGLVLGVLGLDQEASLVLVVAVEQCRVDAVVAASGRENSEVLALLLWSGTP